MSTINFNRSIRQIFVLISVLFMVFFYQGVVFANETPNEKIEIPATANAIWEAIDKNIAEIDKLIKANQLTEIHHYAAAIRDLTNALPTHSASLSPDKLKQVNDNIKYIATLAQRLDASGDAKDKPNTIDNFDKLQKLLNSIRTNYSISNTPIPQEKISQ